MHFWLNRVKFNLMKESDEHIGRKLAAVTKECEELKTEKRRLKKMLNDCLIEIESLRKEIHELKHGPGPGKSNIAGWTLAKSGDYFRLFKKVGGEVKGIHLGKVFDREKALEKIKSKEEELGI